MTARFRVWACRLLLSACALCLTGCPRPQMAGYFGPTEPMAKVVEAVNRNNNAIPTLWAKHYMEATIFDEKGKSHFVNVDGRLLFCKPGELYFDGSKDVIGNVFELGMDKDRYWMTVVQEMSTQWWGFKKNIGRKNTEKIPIRPDLIMEVLGVSDIEADFTLVPMPVMRFNNDGELYMLLWVNQAADRWYAEKEIWYRREDKLPVKVLLFDENGRVLIRADLSKHMPVEIPNTAKEKWPKIATDYRLFFPENKSKMWIQLSEMILQRNDRPKPGSIRFPAEPGVDKVVQIDKDSEQ